MTREDYLELSKLITSHRFMVAAAVCDLIDINPKFNQAIKDRQKRLDELRCACEQEAMKCPEIKC